VRTEHRDGFLLEKGPFNVMVRSPAFEELLDGVADRVRVVTAAPEAKNRYIYRGGRLVRVPTGPVGLFTSGLLSFPGACRALRGLLLSGRGREAEPTLEQFATRRFGREVADTLVSAAIAGILAGDISRLSAYACFPVLEDFDRRSFSPLGRTVRRIPAIIRKRRDPKLRRRWKGLVSLDRGLGGLCDVLAEELGERVQRECPVSELRRDGESFVLRLGGAASSEEMRCRRVVLATPARVTARLLTPHTPAAAQILAHFESASLTVINLAFRRADIRHPLDGFGFLVPRNEPDFPLMGVLWADSAFPHHAPSEYRLLRVFLGGTRTPDVVQRSAAELLTTSRAALADVLGVSGEPVLVDVCPYPDAIPQYTLGHRARIAEVRRDVSRTAGLHLAANYLEGVSINDCVTTARRVADELIAARQTVPA
jgi:protoporphyrinogen/coproporphyrinogen III oxidase